jgi:hypothetical protein
MPAVLNRSKVAAGRGGQEGSIPRRARLWTVAEVSPLRSWSTARRHACSTQTKLLMIEEYKPPLAYARGSVSR